MFREEITRVEQLEDDREPREREEEPFEYCFRCHWYTGKSCYVLDECPEWASDELLEELNIYFEDGGIGECPVPEEER